MAHITTRTSTARAVCRQCHHLTLSQRPRAFATLGSRGPAPTKAIIPRTFAPARSQRCLHASPARLLAAPKNRDRGPASKEDTQTDFGAMDMLANTPAPTTGVDACMDDGFALNSGLRITGGSGVLLVGGEAFKWRPWVRKEDTSEGVAHGKLRNAKGQWEVDAHVWGLLDVVWPKPDLLVLGTGPSILPLSPATRAQLAALGVRVEVQDTRNAAAQYNLLATERGIQQVAAALVPIGWKER